MHLTNPYVHGLNPKYFRLLAGFFSRRVLAGLQAGRFPLDVPEIVEASGYKTVLDPSSSVSTFFNDLYKLLWINYRCEYFYKNTLARDILEKYHLEHSTVLSEFRADSCLADFVVVNGTSAVYEIKTELDSFDRLERQLTSYRKVFDKIYVVTPTSHGDRVKARTPDEIGIVVLSADGQLTKIRESQSNKHNVDPTVIFASLRSAEYTSLIERQTGAIPQTRPAEYYAACREIISKFEPVIVHDEMVNLLKKRCAETRVLTAMRHIPASLTMAYLASPFNKKQDTRFLQAIDQPYNYFI